MKQRKYDIFISYRRDGGSETTKHLRDVLTEKGYRVFYDVESLRSGPFNTELYRVIENTRDFVLVLPAGALDRCVNEDDWVRLEIEHAHRCGKNIVPVMLRGFSFPEQLPESLEFLRVQNGLVANTEYWDAFVERLQEFLQSRTPIPRHRRWIPIAAAIAAAALIGFFCVRHFSVYPHNQAQRNTVSSVIDSMSLNLTRYDAAAQTYLSGLDKALQFVEGRTADSALDVRVILCSCLDEIDRLRMNLQPLPDAVRFQLTGSPFDTGDIDAFVPAITNLFGEFADQLVYVRDHIVGNEGMSQEHQKEVIEVLREICSLDAEYVFYALNEVLLPVTDEAALAELKSTYLPMLTTVYSKGLYWTGDRQMLIGKQNGINERYKQQMKRMVEIVDEQDEELGEYMLDMALKWAREQIESGAPNTDELQTWIDGIEEKRRRLQEAQQKLIDLEIRLEEKREAARRNYGPAADDDAWTLWGKGKMFLTLAMPQDAVSCFDGFMEKCDDEYRFCGLQARRFAQHTEELGVAGGVVIFGLEEGKPEQALETGDIIFEVNGQTVANVTEFEAELPEDGVVPVRVLRFTDEGCEIVDSRFDQSLGRIMIMGLNNEPG